MATASVARDRDRTTSRIGWPLERVLFALAGTMTLLSAALSVCVSPWFLLLSVLVGVNQWLFVLLGACPASLILQRLFSLPSILYPTPASAIAWRWRGRSCPRPASQRSSRATTASKP
jgi:hypothetical protein